jgi:hypothetical protein
MPNWCFNRLTISGGASDVTTFCQRAAGRGPRYLLSGRELEDALSSHRVSTAWKRRVRRIGARAELGASVRSAWAPIEPMAPLSLHALVPVPLAVRRREYSASGYHWQMEHWGVKWDADHVVRRDRAPGCVQYEFRTPWDPPIAWLHAVAPRWPTLTLRLEYVEEDQRQAGALEARDGHVAVLEALRWNVHGRDAVGRFAVEQRFAEMSGAGS